MAAANAIAISTASKVLSASSSSSIRSELQSVRSCFFWLLIACTAIVAVGVVLESAEDWFPSGKLVLNMSTGIFRPSRFIRWRKMVINLGWMLVIVGVIGEGIFEVATSGADEMLQAFNNTLLAITTEQAGNAANSAKIAHVEANRAKAIADAAESVAKLTEGKAAAVSKRAEQIDADLTQAEGVVSARFIVPADRDSVIEGFKSFNGQTVELLSYVGDTEAFFLCNSLWGITYEAGMKPVGGCGTSQFTVPMISPIRVSDPDMAQATKIAHLLTDTAKVGAASAVTGPSLVIFVGTKGVVGIGPQYRRQIKSGTKKH